MQLSSLWEDGAVTLVQAARTKEVIARIRRETGRRDMGAFSIEAWPEATELGRERLASIIGSRLGAKTRILCHETAVS